MVYYITKLEFRRKSDLTLRGLKESFLRELNSSESEPQVVSEIEKL